MVHPAFPGLVKIGSAVDCNKRVAQFNTGCPYRSFQMLLHVRSNNRLNAERLVHAMLEEHRLPGGEWFNVDVDTAERALFEIEEYVWEEGVQ